MIPRIILGIWAVGLLFMPVIFGVCTVQNNADVKICKGALNDLSNIDNDRVVLEVGDHIITTGQYAEFVSTIIENNGEASGSPGNHQTSSSDDGSDQQQSSSSESSSYTSTALITDDMINILDLPNEDDPPIISGTVKIVLDPLSDDDDDDDDDGFHLNKDTTLKQSVSVDTAATKIKTETSITREGNDAALSLDASATSLNLIK